MRRPHMVLGGVVAAIGVGALWFGFLGSPPLWTDEAYTLEFSASWSAVGQDVHPPVYYAIVRLWFDVMPDTIASVRALSAISFLAAVGVWGLLATRWQREGRIPNACVLTVIVLSVVSPHALLFGRMGRYFALAGLVVAVALLLWWRARERAGVSTAMLVIAAHVFLGVINQPTLLVALAAETVTILLRERAALRRQLVFVVITGLLTVVLLAMLPTDASKLGGGEDANHLAMAGVAAVLPLWSMTVGETVSPFNPISSLVPFAAWTMLLGASVAGVRAHQTAYGKDLSRSRWRRGFAFIDRHLPSDPAVLLCAALVGAQIGVQVAENFTVDLAHTAIQAPKYFLPIAPALYLLAGFGVERLRAARRGTLLTASVTTAIAVGWCFGNLHIQQGEQFLYPSYALPWDDVVADVDGIVAEHAGRGEGVAVISSDVAFQHLFIDDSPRADVFDLSLPEDEQVVYDGAVPGEYRLLVFVTRQRLNSVAEENVDGALYVAEHTEYTRAGPETTYGHVDPGLRRIQEIVSGRDLETFLVKVVVLAHNQSS